MTQQLSRPNQHGSSAPPSVPRSAPTVFVGIDTHADSHHLAIIDADGRPIADAGFPTTITGYARLEKFLISQGRPAAIGVEGTASYGAAISHRLAAARHRVIEVNRPDRRARPQAGKTHPAGALSPPDPRRDRRPP